RPLTLIVLITTTAPPDLHTLALHDALPISTEILGQPKRDAGASAYQDVFRCRPANGVKVLIRQGIDDEVAPILCDLALHRRTDCRSTSRDRPITDMADRMGCLQRQPTTNVGIGHRRQRMFFHARFI